MTIYKNHKGNLYRVLQDQVDSVLMGLADKLGKTPAAFTATHTETKEEIEVFATQTRLLEIPFYTVDEQHSKNGGLVLYEDLEGKKWVRPYRMFHESFFKDGKFIKRYEKMKQEEMFEMMRKHPYVFKQT
ncbi:hypothetical protein CON15_19345 [Bacillus cereus]|uniref:DUF1653 domain-containing protein n=1 Tax=Bacillus thuringiensis TaxID=1428 RepID=A0AB36VF94_BACTU|nr:MULTISPECIES: DUF1653 domain-containing protein [Bacillus cereus group]PDZ55697.1 hypothetical protein CON15_19345 [Bacillus cereus]PFC28476.1 hypothetical protein CN299_19590 [Bacillus thuringiensis]PFO26227.1 hypothetical protein COJ78_29430 [Bacillus thuringiensis]PFS40317.1 hypothetical protein COK48_00300 [Bacillus thuringiensis]PFS58226.1 hypothetical protein COK64_17755 [Bacillus thuringiensis]